MPRWEKHHQAFACAGQNPFERINDHEMMGLGDEAFVRVADKLQQRRPGLSPRQELPGGQLGLVLRAEWPRR